MSTPQDPSINNNQNSAKAERAALKARKRTESAAAKRERIIRDNKKLFRPQAFAALGILIVMLFVFFAFCLDPLISWSLKSTTQAIVGAKVDIDKLHFDVLNLKFTIGRMQVTNPNNTMRNLFEIRDYAMHTPPRPLLSGQVVIEELKIGDLLINTPREKDGKIKRKVSTREQSELEKAILSSIQGEIDKTIESIPTVNMDQMKDSIDPKKILASYDPQIEKVSEEYQAKIKANEEKWSKNFSSENTNIKKLKELETKISNYKFTKTNNIIEIKKQIDDLDDMLDELKQVKKDISAQAKEFRSDLKQLKADTSNLKDVAEQDYDDLKALAKLPDLETLGFSKTLFNDIIQERTQFVLHMVDELRAYVPTMPVDTTKKEKPKRGKGQNISFPGQETYPRFLIKKVSVSGSNQFDNNVTGYSAKGLVTGITSEPAVYKKPLVFELSGSNPNRAALAIGGKLNLINSIKGDATAKLSNLQLPNMELPDNDYLPSKISNGNANISAAVDFGADDFTLDMTVTAKNLISDYSSRPEATDFGMKIVREVLSKIDILQLKYKLKCAGKNFDMELSSNLDDILKARFKEVIGAEVDAALAELKADVDQRLKVEEEKVKTQLAAYEKEYTAKLDSYEAKLKEYQNKLDSQKDELKQKATGKSSDSTSKTTSTSTTATDSSTDKSTTTKKDSESEAKEKLMKKLLK